MNKTLEKIVALLEEARVKHGTKKETLEKNGEVIYANGNDGTVFDWEVNSRLGEFGYGVKDGSVWAFKCHIEQHGTAEVFCYPNGEPRPVEVIERELASPEEMRALYNLMIESADNRRLFNKTLNELGLL